MFRRLEQTLTRAAFSHPSANGAPSRLCEELVGGRWEGFVSILSEGPDPELLDEVRQLRLALQRATAAQYRLQVTLERIQLQQGRVDAVVRSLESVAPTSPT